MLNPEIIQRLRSQGLSIHDAPFFPENHVAYPSGYLVLKPAAVPGNGHRFAESWFANENGNEIRTESPAMRIWWKDNQWHIEVGEFAPGPGYSDFREHFTTEEDACERIIRYFFDPKDSMFKLWYDEMEKSAQFLKERHAE